MDVNHRESCLRPSSELPPTLLDQGGDRGFTLVEILIALMLVSGFLVPLSGWLYKNHVNQRALDRFCALGLLEREMNRAFLEREQKFRIQEFQEPCACRVEINALREGDEIRLQGEVLSPKGPVLGRLTLSHFGEKDSP